MFANTRIFHPLPQDHPPPQPEYQGAQPPDHPPQAEGDHSYVVEDIHLDGNERRASSFQLS